MIHGTHQLTYVILSIVVAVLGSLTALDLQRQVRAHRGRIRFYWLCATAVAMGISIFSMHFIAMLGFDAGVPIRYDPWLTIGSLMLAVSATSFAFIAVQSKEPTLARIGFGGLAMGSGICLMHYMGMAAMRTPATVSYNGWLVAASFAIAVGVSWMALAIALRRPRLELRLGGAVLLGLAISSMHYTAMAAVSFEPALELLPRASDLDELRVAVWTGTGTLVLLVLALISAMFDRRFEAVSLREAAAVAARELHLREVLTRMPIGVIVVSKEAPHDIDFANALALELFAGVHPAELLLRDVEGKPLKPHQHHFRRALTEGVEFAGELVTLKDRGGSARCLEISAAALSSRIDDSEQVILTAQDVTGRMQAEQALQQAQKLETIGHLTGGVAHDFNNLLTPIVGGLDLLHRDKSISPPARQLAETALVAATKAGTLVQRLLAFARRQTLQPRPIDMAAILMGIRELIERSIGPSIQVAIEAERGLVARIDPGQFELAILNLVVNARDAMAEAGTLFIKVTGEELAGNNQLGLPAGDYVRISVRDTGVGMDTATLRRAIEPFFSTKAAGKGTGLGLSMVHGLAAQSGGTLHLESAPGLGTSAELWLPLLNEPAIADARSKIDSLTASRPATILLVDDEELVRSATREMLQEMGHKVVEASSGVEALAALKAESDIELLVTDLLMPNMSGTELVQEVRSCGSRIPVLIITGYASPGELDDAVPRLGKPFSAQQLKDAVAEVLRQDQPNIIDFASRRRPSQNG